MVDGIMAYLEINPRYREFCQRNGLTTAADFMALPAVIVSGHPNRHVTQVTIGSGPTALVGFMKRDLHISWAERLRNAIAGFGFVSRSCREARVLRNLEKVGVNCPEQVAEGEDDDGRGFLLVRELAGAVELREYLRARAAVPERRRKQFARKLGQALARIHNCGIDHPDLYSKHVFINPEDQSISVLDWQRSRLRSRVGWPQRWRDLAALEATLSDDLVSSSERATCLRAYLRECRIRKINCPNDLLFSAFRIHRLEKRLLHQRRVRELREKPLAVGTQGVIWCYGEALCLTREFHDSLKGQIPDWLFLSKLPPEPRQFERQAQVSIGAGRQAQLVCRREIRPGARICGWLRRHPVRSPELCHAGILFRLQRYRIPSPRLLAFGQCIVPPWRVDSFVLIEAFPDAVCLPRWLREHAGVSPKFLKQSHRLIREAGILLRRIHDAGCYLSNEALGNDAGTFQVRQLEGEGPAVLLDPRQPLHTRRRPQGRQALDNIAAVLAQISGPWASQTNQLRFLLSYLRAGRLSPAIKRFARLLLHRNQAVRPARFSWVPRPLLLGQRLLQPTGRAMP